METHAPPKSPSASKSAESVAPNEGRGRDARLHAPAWLAYALLCVFWWGLWGFLSKLGSDRIQPHQLQLLFTVGLLPPVIVAWARLGGKLETDLRGSLYGILNGIFSGLGMLAFYAALARGKASIIGPFTALFPLLTMLLAFVFLRERINAIQAAGGALALVAIFILSL